MISSKEVGGKMKNKREIYRFISVEAGAYVPPYELISIWHLKDLLAGKKTITKSKEIKHITIPQFDGLTFETIIEYAESYDEVMEKFPIKRELEKYPRQYIANVIYTTVGKPFYDWV